MMVSDPRKPASILEGKVHPHPELGWPLHLIMEAVDRVDSHQIIHEIARTTSPCILAFRVQGKQTHLRPDLNRVELFHGSAAKLQLHGLDGGNGEGMLAWEKLVMINSEGCLNSRFIRPGDRKKLREPANFTTNKDSTPWNYATEMPFYHLLQPGNVMKKMTLAFVLGCKADGTAEKYFKPSETKIKRPNTNLWKFDELYYDRLFVKVVSTKTVLDRQYGST